MKKVLILAGGTGSISLQTGLHQLYGNSLRKSPLARMAVPI